MECRRVKCTCLGGKKTISTTPTDLPSVQAHTPTQCIRQQPRSTKCWPSLRDTSPLNYIPHFYNTGLYLVSFALYLIFSFCMHCASFFPVSLVQLTIETFVIFFQNIQTLAIQLIHKMIIYPLTIVI